MAQGWENILIASVSENGFQDLIGKTIHQVAEERSRSGIETALDLLIETKATLVIVSFNSSEENLKRF